MPFPTVLVTNILFTLDTADSSDHQGAATAIAKGLAAGHTKEKPGFWIHISGTGILTWKDSETKTYGEPPSQPPYDDLENVSGLTGLPDKAFHRDVDKLVLQSASDAVKTAIVCPPTIYGTGRGPVNKRSRQVYNLARITLELGKAPQLGRGLTVSPIFLMIPNITSLKCSKFPLYVTSSQHVTHVTMVITNIPLVSNTDSGT